MVKHAFDRVKAGLPMPGIVEVPNKLPIGQAVYELSIMIGAGELEDFDNQVKFVPIR